MFNKSASRFGQDYAGKIILILCIIIEFRSCICSAESRVDILTLVSSGKKSSIDNGVVTVEPKLKFQIRLSGSGFNKSSTYVSFANKGAARGASCEDLRTTTVKNLEHVSGNGNIAIISLKWNIPGKFYVCLKEESSQTGSKRWIHQGSDDWLSIKVKDAVLIPLWLRIMLVIILILLSGLFSGLNLGLMSLEPNDLQIVMNCGDKNERKYAKTIIPVRKRGNFLLCTLLLGNTLVNSSFTILLDDLTSGIVAVIGSTAAIVIFGEIVPQSICSRYGLAVGARTIFLTKMFMIITFPLSFPISKLLDLILGEEIGAVYNKHQLLEMLKLQDEYNDLEKDEVGIISGALKYKSKTVQDVMTTINDCFLLDEDIVLDFKTMTHVIKSGYSRIPIFSGERSNIVALLYVKDLAFVDPDDCIPLLSVIKFYNHQVRKVFYDTRLDEMLEWFKTGKSHLAVVIKVIDEGEGDPVYEAVGIVTLEDIIEEIIQSEIVDETDVYIDNVSGRKVPGRKGTNQDFSLFSASDEDKKKRISPQLAFALFQYLSTAVEPFKEEYLSRAVLKKLIDQAGAVEEKMLNADKDDANYIYRRGVSADYFICVIQGQVEVVVGNENLVFIDGPFTVFGMQALFVEKGRAFIPDYEVRILSNVQYLKIQRTLYRSAIRATQLERSERAPSDCDEFDELFFNKKTDLRANVIADENGLLLVPVHHHHKEGSSENTRFETPI
eukprot:gene5476-6160_t